MEWLDQLKAFHRLFEAEDYAQASALAPGLLNELSTCCSSTGDDDSDDNDTIQRLIVEAYARCLLEIENFEALKQVIEQYKFQTRFASVYRYALYRLGDYEAIVAALPVEAPGVDSTLEKHLRAQALYHLSKTDESSAIYEELLEECSDADEKEQLLVNLTASLFDRSVPYVRNPRATLLSQVQQCLDASDPESLPVDLVYNFASLRLLEGDASARKMLQSLVQQARGRDRDIIAYNLEWSQRFLYGSLPPSMKQTPSSDSNLRSVKLATCDTLTTEAKSCLTGLQSRMALYNTAVSHLRSNKLSECQKACKELLTDHSGLWWTSQALVLQAYCDKSKGLQLLAKQLDKVKSSEESPARDAAWLYLEAHRAELSGEGLDVSKLPPSLRASNGVLASRSARQSSVDASELSVAQQADNEMIFREYGKACELYQQLCDSSPSDPTAAARYVTALSHVDPKQAVAFWGERSRDFVSPVLVDEGNGAELEQQELRRFKVNRVVMNVSEPSRPPRSHSSVLRRRARKRDEYLARLEEKGLYNKDRPTHPDPERWLPKAERSYGRKKKGAKTHKGSQGGFSEKDASKLDVVARQNMQHDSSAPSTAHVVPTSEGGVGGRKAGRRR
jgi:hypothetical protein